MPKRALIDHRPWLLAGIAAALAYYFFWNNPIGGLWLILLKGAGLACLSAYAFMRAPGADGKLLAVALLLASAADMALELWFVVGGALFAASHLVMVALYLRNRRERTVWSQRMLAVILLIGVPVVAYLLSEQVEIAIYASILGLMAATAWISRFPRYRVGIGAILFVISDWLIFSRMGSFDLGVLPDTLVWPLYFAGQVMIATGVVQTLRGERSER